DVQEARSRHGPRAKRERPSCLHPRARRARACPGRAHEICSNLMQRRDIRVTLGARACRGEPIAREANLAERSATPSRIVVIGGGITGLAAAHRLVARASGARRPMEVVLLEAKDRVGGSI